MPGGGANPGERRGGRRAGSRNRATIRREIIEKAATERQIAARAAAPIQGKRALERLTEWAMAHFEAALVKGDPAEIAVCFERALCAARDLTRYQSPTFKAIAVATTDMRPPAYDLTRLSVKQVEQLVKLLQLAGPTNIAGRGPVVERNGDRPLAIADDRRGSSTKSRDAALGANGRRVLPASGALGPLRKESADGP